MPASFGNQSAADVAAAVAAHSADTTIVHGIPDTSKLATFDAANPADTVISAVTGAPVSVGGGGSAATTTFTPAGNLAATDVQAALVELDGEKQPLDADLTAIAGLSPSNDDLVQRKAGAWTNRTPAQVKTDLALVKGDVGLANVDNTSDANKPVSTAQQTALDLKAPLASPVLTGNPTAPTPAQGDNDTSIATTAYVQSELDAITPNVVVATQSADYSASGVIAAMTQLGTINPSITITSGSRVLVRTSGTISESASGPLLLRLSIDNGASFVNLGRTTGDANGVSLTFLEVLTGLSAGAHTVKMEYTKSSGGIIYLRASTQPTLERFSIILEEIRS